MRKFAIVLLTLVLCSSLAFAVNAQKIYSVDSEVFSDISKIYVSTGHSLPSTTGPWSGDELYKMISMIDKTDVPAYLKDAYDSVLAELSEDPTITYKNGGAEFDGFVNLDLYLHTYDGDNSAYTRKTNGGITEYAMAGRQYWFGKDLTKTVPFVNISWENWLNSFFYTYIDFALTNSVHGEKEIGSTKINTNIPTLQNNFALDIKLLDVNFPSRAFAAFGGDGWSTEIGRDRLSWGAGSTGNLVLSDNFPYYDNVRFTTYGEKFKYTYLVSFFPHRMNYYEDGVNKFNSQDSTHKLKGTSFYTAHRFEGRFLKDKLGFTLTEAIMYSSEDNSIQFAALSPMYFMHNAYMPENSNSTLAFEANYTPIKGLNVYGQLLLDQFAFPGFETAPGAEKSEKTTTNGFAALLGVKYTAGLFDGTLEVNPEVAIVGPYTYLRDSYEKYGIDYTGAVKSRLYSWDNLPNAGDICYDEYVIGYKYGPDCFVANVDASWKKDKLSLGAQAMYLVHGTNDIWTKWRCVPANTSKEDYKNQFLAPTTESTENYKYSASEMAKRNSKWVTIDVGVNGEYKLLDNLDLSAAVDFVMMNGVFNYKGASLKDIQVILGGKYQFL